MSWAFRNTRWGLVVRIGRRQRGCGAGDGLRRSTASALSPPWRAASLAGVGGAFLSLYYPGSWNEGLSSGQGLMAVALVIFARWDPLRCFYAALLFGGAGALGPALQSVGVTGLLPLQRRALRAHAARS